MDLHASDKEVSMTAFTHGIKAWISEITTIHGITVILTTVLAVLTGQLSIQHALIGAFSGIVLAVLPEAQA
jgi:hypothetical protein